MRLQSNETTEQRSARINAQWRAMKAREDQAVLTRLASTEAGRLTLADAIDNGRRLARV